MKRRWAAALGGLVALAVSGSARAFVIDTRADERRCPGPNDSGCGAAQGSAQPLLGDELELIMGPGFVLIRGAGAIAEAACSAQPIANAALSDVLRRVQARLGVDAELGIVFAGAPPSCNSMYYVPIANDVRGIGYGHDDGRELFDDSADSRLEGVAFLNDWPYWRAHPEEFVSAFQHEVAHRWGARVQARIDGVASNELLGRGLAHWSYFLDTQGSPHEGNVWVADPLGLHSETPPHGSRFSALDLYLMGVGLPEEVEPFALLREARVAGRDCRGQPVSAASPPQSCAPIDASGQLTQIHIEDILAVEGPRDPPASHAPRRVSALAVVLDGALAPFDAAACREFSAALSPRFADFTAATAGRLQLEPALAGGECDELAWTPPPAPPIARSTSDGCSVARSGFVGPSARRPAGVVTGALPALLALFGLAIRASKARRARLRSAHDQDW